MGGGGKADAADGVRSVGDVKLLARAVTGIELKDLRSLADEGKKQVGSGVVAIVGLSDDGKAGNPVVVFANFNNEDTRENAFNLDPHTSARLDPDKHYQVRDLLSDDPKEPLWRDARSGREILESGLYSKLDPYQVQALEIYEVK